ncbi:caspase family protein [Pseudomonadota bacterium]
MKRAAVLIGIQEAKKLPKLEAVWDGLGEIERWANDQGMQTPDLVVITDRGGPVDIKQIKQAIKKIVDDGTYEQLIVYFAGHGVNNGQNEYWLLSEAKNDPDEAVNLKASEDLAAYNGIPHVVFVSDACRTAAQGISSQTINGGVIFPIGNTSGVANKVDVFYATTLGRPALEIQDVNESVSKYKGIYTETLIEALDGKHAAIRKFDNTVGGEVIQLWDLHDFLNVEIPVRVWKRVKKSQTPDSKITSRPGSWLSLLLNQTPSGSTEDDVPTIPPPETAPTASTLFDRLRRSIARSLPRALPNILSAKLDHDDAHERDFKRRSDAAAKPFGPLHFETGCGFKVTGARIEAVFGMVTDIEINEPERDWVRFSLPNEEPRNTLLLFDNESCVVLPGLHNFVTGLTFVDGELVNVSYDPMDYSWRWGEYSQRLDEVQRLRSVVAAKSAMGTFRLADDEEGRQLAKKMQINKGYDPTLALYAAYAYRDQGRHDRLRDMAEYQRNDLGIVLFDIAMLARRIDGKQLDERGYVLPFGPLLSQGWALLPAHGLTLPDSLGRIRDLINTNSLWTLYGKECVDVFGTAIEQGKI